MFTALSECGRISDHIYVSVSILRCSKLLTSFLDMS